MDSKARQVAFIGSSHVGKTAIITRLVHSDFYDSYSPTQEDRYSHTFKPEGKDPLVAELVDTTGADGQVGDSVRNMAIVFSDVIVVVFSVKSRMSFERARQLIEEIASTRPARLCPVLLIGNHATELSPEDSDYPSSLSSREALQMLEDSPVAEKSAYLAVSALKDHNISDIGSRICRLFRNDQQEEQRASQLRRRSSSGVRRVLLKVNAIRVAGQNGLDNSDIDNGMISPSLDNKRSSSTSDRQTEEVLSKGRELKQKARPMRKSFSRSALPVPEKATHQALRRTVSLPPHLGEAGSTVKDRQISLYMMTSM